MGISYKDSGVDIEKGDALVDKITKMVKKTYNSSVKSGVGGFAALYELSPGRYLASSTDGVGTKLKLAIDTGNHQTIGIDLVAMCVNDLICTGARPLFFLDYYASGKLDLEKSEAILSGIVEGCLQSSMALIGGETAEMPGMYSGGDYDLAGFSVGEVFESDLIDGKKITSGDALIGIASSGPHSNGYSLIRKLIDMAPQSEQPALKKEALIPTRIYVKTIQNIWNIDRALIKGISHITGSGLLNVPRMNPHYIYELEFMPGFDEIPPLFKRLQELSGLNYPELLRTFNMGVGLVMATDRPSELLKSLEAAGEKAWIIGQVGEKTHEEKIRFDGQFL